MNEMMNENTNEIFEGEVVDTTEDSNVKGLVIGIAAIGAAAVGVGLGIKKLKKELKGYKEYKAWKKDQEVEVFEGEVVDEDEIED